MRSALVAVVLGLSLFGTHPAPAAPFTPAFDNLKVELEARRDKDFGGTLDAAQKKQQKAVLKCLALIDKPSASAQDDLKTFASVAKLLEKAYPVEMSFETFLPLRELCYLASENFQMSIYEDLLVLQGRHLRMVPSSTSAKAEKLFKAGIAAKNRGDHSILSIYATNSLKGWKLLLKAIPLAQASELLPAPVMDFLADGINYSADASTISWTYHSRSRRIELSGSYTDSGTGDLAILYISGLIAQGNPEVTIDVGQFERQSSSTGNEIFESLGGGFFSITTMDLVGRQFTGSFDMNVSGSTDFEVIGTFTATWNLVVVND